MKLNFLRKSQSPYPLWTKSFTILTLGSVISFMGNAVMSFIMSLMMLDVSQSVLIYSLCLACQKIGQVLAPILIGPHLDQHSRKKMIYIMDFTSATIYLFYGFTFATGAFRYWMPMVGNVILGGIDSVYRTAYSSLLPMVVHKDNLQKAFSISGILEQFSLIVSPFAVLLYKYVGVGPVLFGGSMIFALAAVTELFIQADETEYLSKAKEQGNHYRDELLIGLRFVNKNRCLLYCCLFFLFIEIANGVRWTSWLPYYQSGETTGSIWYFIVMSFLMSGCFMGNLILYVVKIPPKKRYSIAILLYSVMIAINIPALGLHQYATCALYYVGGICEQIAVNFRTTAVYSSVSNEMRGRFAGILNMSTKLGLVIGQLICGTMEQFCSLPMLTGGAYALVTIPFIVIFILLGRKEIKPLYNLEKENLEA